MKKDFTDLAYQDVACGSKPDRGVGGYVRVNDVNHASDNGGAMMISQGYCSYSCVDLY
jgi:hypothetical protein